MTPRAATLAALLLLWVRPAPAAPPFSTELTLGFGYEGSSTDRPLVVLDGVPSDAYAYSADARAHSVAVAATRWLSPVDDDGRTALALLPYVARASGVTARFALDGSSRDSFGRFAGQASTYEVRFAGDGTLREAELSGTWFLGRSLAASFALEHARERETSASTSLESPSGRADVSTAGTRASSTAVALGVALRLGEHEVSVSGRTGASDRRREDASAFTGGAAPFLSGLETEGLARTGALTARLLLLERRLAVDARAEYSRATSSSDLDTTLSGPYAKGRSISRRAAVEATWFSGRRLSLTAGLAWARRDDSSGAPGSLRPSNEETVRTFGAGVRWFATERVSASLAAALVEGTSIAPPGSATFQRLEETTARVTLGASARF